MYCLLIKMGELPHFPTGISRLNTPCLMIGEKKDLIFIKDKGNKNY
jgi:hypothetical protein